MQKVSKLKMVFGATVSSDCFKCGNMILKILMNLLRGSVKRIENGESKVQQRIAGSIQVHYKSLIYKHLYF